MGEHFQDYGIWLKFCMFIIRDKMIIRMLRIASKEDTDQTASSE